MQMCSEVCRYVLMKIILKNIVKLFMRKGILILLAFAHKQHLVKVTLSANILIG